MLISINCRVITKACSRITVDRGGFLEADSTIFGLCDTGWKGIEVWGEPDACPNNYAFQGRFVGRYSTIEHAEIGLLAGARSLPGNKSYAGGTLWSEHGLFDDNYVDVMFIETNYGSLCECLEATPPLGGGLYHHFWYNHFGQQRPFDFCDFEVNNELQTSYGAGSYAGAGLGTPPCHIVDLNWYPNVWTIPNNPQADCWRTEFDELKSTAAGLNAFGVDIFNYNTYHSNRTCNTPSYK